MTTDNHCSVPSLFFREKIRVEKSAVYLPVTSARYLGHTKALLLIWPPRGAGRWRVVSPPDRMENREQAEQKSKACKHGLVCEEHVTVRCLSLFQPLLLIKTS